MARYSDLVMVCDRCGLRETLKSNPVPEERSKNEEVRSRMGRWHSLRTQDMGGDAEWEFCPTCFSAFIAEYTKGSK